MTDWCHYFAYGSNLLPARLRARTPSARLVGTGRLDGYRMAFDHVSRTDGSAKCGIAPARGSVVHGAVFVLPVAERPALDRAEDLGTGYDRLVLPIRVDAAEQPCDCYIPLPGTLDPGARPFRWYRDIVLAGARWHAFPDALQRTIAAEPVQEDPDPERTRHHQAIIDAAG